MFLMALLGLSACNHANKTTPGRPGTLHLQAYLADSLGTYQEKENDFYFDAFTATDTVGKQKFIYAGQWEIRVDRMTDSEMKVHGDTRFVEH